MFGYFAGEEWAFIDALVTMLTVMGVLYTSYQNYKQSQKIKIYVKVNTTQRYINHELIRRNVTRSEIQGILGAMRVDMTKGYHLASIGNSSFSKDIYRIQSGKSDKLTVHMTDKELVQFRFQEAWEKDKR